MASKLSYFFDWQHFPEDAYPRILQEFLDYGENRFVLTNVLAERMAKEPGYIALWQKLLKDFHAGFAGVHAPCGKTRDLCVPEPEVRKEMLSVHKTCLKISRDFGCRTYTIHVGAAHYCYDHVPLETIRDFCRRTLDELLPVAEQCGVILAVENSFEPPNSAKEVMGLVTPYLSSPSMGTCFDTGHANCVASAPGKDKSRYEDYFPVCWWESDGVIYEDDGLEQMHDSIVTCHMHDNNGYGDYHDLPGYGTVNWPEVVAKLRTCPRMVEFQTEVVPQGGPYWSGKRAVPAGGWSIRRIVESFQKMGF